MYEIGLREAENRLAELISKAAHGEEVIIKEDGGAAFQIVALGKTVPRPRFGSARGLVRMSEDFDKPVPGFEEYQP